MDGLLHMTTSDGRLGPERTCVGQRVGPYTIYVEVASGGMAALYLARRDTDPTEFVALKLIHQNLIGQPGFVPMFLDEARIASQLRHPNICRVKDFGAVDGTYYLAMQYLVGEPLSSVFRRASTVVADGRRHAALIARLIVDACDGLHAAHELTDDEGKPLNVVHRDVSPENLFVTYDAVVKVVDFGIACAAHQTHRTRTGILKGKFGYIAPELLHGEKVDRRADVWGLGIVAWELLTGRRLFRRRTDAETLDAVANSPIIAPSAVRALLPSAVDGPVLRALSRDRSQRFATARDFGRALRRALGGEIASRSEVAAWLCEHFYAERRRKMQLLELMTRIPCSSPETSLPEAPTQLRISSGETQALLISRQLQRGSAGGILTQAGRMLRSPGRLLGAAVLLTSAAIVSALAWGRDGGVLKNSSAVGLSAAPITSQRQSVDSKPTSVSGQADAAALELPGDQGYVVEVEREAKRSGKLVLRIRPDNASDAGTQPSLDATAARINTKSVETAAVIRDDPKNPPAWLSDALRADGVADHDLMRLRH